MTDKFPSGISLHFKGEIQGKQRASNSSLVDIYRSLRINVHTFDCSGNGYSNYKFGETLAGVMKSLSKTYVKNGENKFKRQLKGDLQEIKQKRLELELDVKELYKMLDSQNIDLMRQSRIDEIMNSLNYVQLKYSHFLRYVQTLSNVYNDLHDTQQIKSELQRAKQCATDSTTFLETQKELILNCPEEDVPCLIKLDCDRTIQVLKSQEEDFIDQMVNLINITDEFIESTPQVMVATIVKDNAKKKETKKKGPVKLTLNAVKLRTELKVLDKLDDAFISEQKREKIQNLLDVEEDEKGGILVYLWKQRKVLVEMLENPELTKDQKQILDLRLKNIDLKRELYDPHTKGDRVPQIHIEFRIIELSTILLDAVITKLERDRVTNELETLKVKEKLKTRITKEDRRKLNVKLQKLELECILLNVKVTKTATIRIMNEMRELDIGEELRNPDLTEVARVGLLHELRKVRILIQLNGGADLTPIARHNLFQELRIIEVLILLNNPNLTEEERAALLEQLKELQRVGLSDTESEEEEDDVRRTKHNFRYIDVHVKNPLVKGIVECTLKKPTDPMCYLSNFLQNYNKYTSKSRETKEMVTERNRLRELKRVARGSRLTFDDDLQREEE